MHQSHYLASGSSFLSQSIKTPRRAQEAVLQRMSLRMRTGIFSMMLERMEQGVKKEVAFLSIARDNY